MQKESPQRKRVSWGAISALSALLGMRMLGLFMVLPVLALYVREMPGATPLLGGLALGAYGLTQAILQIPFGRFSDRYGRKPVILLGLALFAAGSVIAALASSPLGVIAGRALQGSGAISAAVMAFAADLSPQARRTRVMALFGMVIGVAFVLAFVVGPSLAGAFGVPGLFWLAAAFAVAGAALVLPLEAPALARPEAVRPWSAVFPAVAPYALGVFLLHALMTATFLAAPVRLVRDFGIPQAEHGGVYLPVMLGSLLLLVPLILLQERRSSHMALILAVLCLGLGQVGLAWAGSNAVFVVALATYFGGFNFVEAQFPAQVTALSGPEGRGTALGLYTSAQFLGAFAGGLFGGVLQGAGGVRMVLGVNSVVAGGWLAVLLFVAVRAGAGRRKTP